MSERLQYIGHFEQLPPSVIADISINKEMAESVQDPRLLQWLDKDFLLNHAAFFGLALDTGTLLLTQPPRIIRGAMLRYGHFVDEHGMFYGSISAKGTGLSEYGYEERMGEHDDPNGFYGLRHAIDDMINSNEFAREGGRNARGLAVLALDHKKFKEWLHDQKVRNPKYPVEENLARVESNGDTAAIYVRVGGVDRLGDLNCAMEKSRGSFIVGPGGIHSPMAMIRRAVALLNTEIDYVGEEKFVNQYGQLNSEINSQFLRDIARRRVAPRTLHELLLVIESLVYVRVRVTTWNYKVFHKICKRDKNIQPPFMAPVASDHNIDLLGFWYDWESFNHTFKKLILK